MLTISATTIILSVFASILFIVALRDIFQKNHALLRNFPIAGKLRWVFEGQRDKIRQYFNESDLDGTPFNKEQRSIVYQRSKNEIETIPFGTQHNVYDNGHEFVPHTLFPKSMILGERIKIGGKDCQYPYGSSIVNISAMSYGSLSGAAIRALNKGSLEGNFAHNTGEGGISTHHLQGGDLIFQIGTGYFGAGETKNGKRYFSDSMFRVNANLSQVKMIELKLSQGAKPAHGGILPAKKNTKEIAEIRGINPVEQVDSPPYHTAFEDFEGLVDFIQQLRDLSGGKPVGIKLCVGIQSEVTEMFKTFKERDSYPDFITIDGSEGGTGSAPPEHTNSVGMPMADALVFVNRELERIELRDDITLIASGKVIDSFDIFRALALGADGVNIGRGFMFSMGCIQARECNLDTCPVGIATQNKDLEKGLVVSDKYMRVFNYHHNTIEKFKDFASSAGITYIRDIDSSMIMRRTDNGIKSLEKFYTTS